MATKLSFTINYLAHWGERLYLCGSIPELGANDELKAMPMFSDGGSNWSVMLETASPCGFGYCYLLVQNDKVIRREYAPQQQLFPHTIAATTATTVKVNDRWIERPPQQPFYSSAFTGAIFSHACRAKEPVPARGTLLLSCNAPTIRAGQMLALCGSSEALGSWDPARALPLEPLHLPDWSIALKRSALPDRAEFKFLILRESDHSLVAWEGGANRTLSLKEMGRTEAWVYNDLVFRDTQPSWRGAGTAIPVFSLRSRRSFGIGEFTDLPLMVDWAVATGQHFIQILPVNDTTMTRTWTDSYPYNANSTFALNPIYINLMEVGRLKSAATMKEFEKLGKRLNELKEVDYEQVLKAKWEYLHAIYKERGDETLASPAFKSFVEANNDWLRPYALFCYYRDKFGTADFNRWPHISYSEALVEEMCSPHSDLYKEVMLHIFIQYHLHIQLKASVAYAHRKGIVLKGDIPIGISRTSVDAWAHKELFGMESQAGAPPDDFARDGQNWGFPTYNWQEMARDGYGWFRARFAKMSDYFDAYRIDHLLGFFRIWEIPMSAVQGLLGHFNPALPLSPQEMQEHGFHFDERRHLQPYLPYETVQAVFGNRAQEVIENFLLRQEDGTYALKPLYSTQRKVEEAFAGKDGEDTKMLREGLYRLLTEVLFVEDPYQKGTYHPRISAFDTATFARLDEGQRHCYAQLYNDFYYHRHNDFWREEAMKKLPPLIDSTHMLVCGEDLGMIPDCVPSVMSELRILSLEIQRMPKDVHRQFAVPAWYPYLSVATTSTHDMSGLRGWWNENRDLTQRYYNEMMHQQGEAPADCTPWICEAIVRQHMQSPSMLAILPLQDWMAIDGEVRRPNAEEERINIPANPRHYWRYRMHLSLEELLKAQRFNDKVKELITESGR